MANGVEVKCWCQHCEGELAPEHTGKCPHCGKTGKNCSVTASVTVGIKVSMSATHTRAYFEWHNKEIKAIVVAIIGDTTIALLSTVIGLAVGGWLGAIIGFVAGLVLIIAIHIVFYRKVKTIIREITHY